MAEGFPIEVDLGKNTGKKTFQTPEEVEEWLTAEVAAWKWISGHIPELDSRYQRAFEAAREKLKLARTTPQLVGELKALLRQSFNDQAYLHSSRPEAHFIADLRSTNAQAAAAALAYRLRIGLAAPNMQPGHIAYGVCRLALFELGLPTAAAAENSALEATYTSAREELDKWKTSRVEFGTASSAAMSTASEKLRTIETDVEKRLYDIVAGANTQAGELRAAFETLTGEAKTRLEQLTDTYEKQMGLLAPVKYWEERRSRHGRRAVGLGGAALVLAVLGGFGLEYAASKLLGTTTMPPPWQIVVWGGIVTLFLWALRIVVRLLWGNIHLEMDAAERVVMTQAHLALTREGKLTQEQQSLMLSALFRHAATGIVKDDAAPGTPVEVISRLLSGKS
jgi:hypothetical protein